MRAGVVQKDCMCRGCACKGGGDTQPIRLHRDCVQGLRTQGWWGHSANQITQGLRTRVVHARVEGTLSQSDYTGVAPKGCACRGCTQGLRARVALKGCMHRGCMQGLCAQGLRARVAHAVGPSLFVLGCHWLPLANIDLVGDNREFEV